MGFKCGIIGLPNVGKSSLFNVLTKSNVPAENFPFCTIKPNIGIAPVIDDRLSILSKIVNSKKIVYSIMEFVDIAGLVKGASQGEGLGNKFLNAIKDTQAIAHVVRCFKNDSIIHVHGQINPISDIELINIELILSDLNLCEKAIVYIESKKNINNNKNVNKKLKILKLFSLYLKKNKMLKLLNLDIEDYNLVSDLNLLTLKPMMYIANINPDENYNIYLDQIVELAEKEQSKVIPIYVGIESEFSNMEKLEIQDFMSVFKINQLSLQHVIHSGFKLLKLNTFFTVGINEVRAWTIPINSTALYAAGKIHTDFASGFIRVQIITYDDFITCNGVKGVKEQGKCRTEGKKYLVQDGDIVHFLFNK